ncbi:MAG TPA: hypothetical protein VG474_03200 [Solirubrobacteraceae bacterium]|nr:hypothetical protein [Solirubrobacteraceae bacterium]
MTILSTVAGIALIALALLDIFTVLLRPGAQSRLSGALARAVWSLLRHAGTDRRNILSLAGPLAVTAVICFWAVAQVTGWALIYLPHYPHDYALAEGTEAHSPIVGALHASLTTVTTLGSTNVAPKPGWLQVVGPVQAMIGFGMLSAAVAWLLQLYPVLSRRRALAYEIHLLVDTERHFGVEVPDLEESVAAQLYGELTSRLIGVERDLVKFPITYYFAESEPRFALAAAMPALAELAERGTSGECPPPVRLRAAMLQEATHDFARTGSERFVLHRRHREGDALEAFARDHRHAPDGSPADAQRAAAPGA